MKKVMFFAVMALVSFKANAGVNVPAECDAVKMRLQNLPVASLGCSVVENAGKACADAYDTANDKACSGQ